ncbi:YdeI/OmpD-associated family protein [Cellulomonas marina]|uniref:Bacteriocin-protection, YdeI or OmpD-Associated n=1 Tax=Cellulomonas marina TaxID=988821 RepID=A0A1I0VYR1_9CELL|nr:YdeI/OmpD-associated family protein [Cellulomonas marina]SFA81512.1 Bacteriocin-protection, YdeI or OmpD-Associated [Cellulomonas marina]
MPPDLAAALAEAGLEDRWTARRPAVRRRLLVPLAAAATATTRARRIPELLATL